MGKPVTLYDWTFHGTKYKRKNNNVDSKSALVIILRYFALILWTTDFFVGFNRFRSRSDWCFFRRADLHRLDFIARKQNYEVCTGAQYLNGVKSRMSNAVRCAFGKSLNSQKNAY